MPQQKDPNRFEQLPERVSSRTFLSTIRNPATFETATELVQRFRRDFLDAGRVTEFAHNPQHFTNRIYGASMFTLPFLTESIDAGQLTALEVGSGEGSYAAVLSHVFKQYVGVELSAESTERADRFCRALGCSNASFSHDNGANLGEFLAKGNIQYDVIIFNAVVEHMLPEERLAALTAAWGHLKDDGYLVFGETPNTIYPLDAHSTGLWYFNQMQMDIWPDFFAESPRARWRSAMKQALERGDFRTIAYRRGVPINFREIRRWFGLKSIAALRRHVVNDNYDVMFMNKRDYDVHDFLKLCEIRQAAKHNGPVSPDLPDMFSRPYFDLILRKAPLDRIPGDWVALSLGADVASSSDFRKPRGVEISPEAPFSLDLPVSLRETTAVDLMLQVVQPRDSGVLTVETQSGDEIWSRDLPASMREVAGRLNRMTFRLPTVSAAAFPLRLRASRSSAVVSYALLRRALDA